MLVVVVAVCFRQKKGPRKAIKEIIAEAANDEEEEK